MKLNPEVSAKYKLSKDVVSPVISTGKWGSVNFATLNLETADYLYKSGFPFLIPVLKDKEKSDNPIKDKP